MEAEIVDQSQTLTKNSTASLSSIFGEKRFKSLSKIFNEAGQESVHNPHLKRETSSLLDVRDGLEPMIKTATTQNQNSEESALYDENFGSLSMSSSRSSFPLYLPFISRPSQLKSSDTNEADLHPIEELRNKIESLFVSELKSNDGAHCDGLMGKTVTTHVNRAPREPSVEVLATEQDNTLVLTDEESLFTKYGVPTKSIGGGMSGSVKLLEKPESSDIYAMKQFRMASNSHIFAKKIIDEYSIASILHHNNIIKTLDLLVDFEKNVFIQVMEFVPYDFFDLVTNETLSSSENLCYFKQMCEAIGYLHSNGIAHRDLKLENCVVTPTGILKLLDFGSAVIFKRHKHDELIKAKGIVGSDPYLSPELLNSGNEFYDPRPVDIWSIAIIYYCMICKKFPWKAPKESFNNFRLFIDDPDDEDDVSKGPQRILRVFPKEMTELLGSMFELDPKKRISIEKILENEVVRSIESCSEDSNGKALPKPISHSHHFYNL
ncbi:hypothetical protein KAFR_0F02190 [Kazachstania africana CBS 2517]|uniref:non-specific serine/threonine protein kinase n=1 Tax=Kazachstania africana (strain ATCC 22294 / BCRC 22015 / CBS 2517 / CECT 1963 / NBRC 1671 / NRRL Y-8276) TaxID=1071382 RepID=H2AWR6_KAZAF|nr:hypothetical protein KAFR_0F02190 [Kazachstania africana CBS 2517]CCF58816.1 hypothetical protein KAFR_0F02190 [Kazachstania africana CBS 2517]